MGRGFNSRRLHQIEVRTTTDAARRVDFPLECSAKSLRLGEGELNFRRMILAANRSRAGLSLECWRRAGSCFLPLVLLAGCSTTKTYREDAAAGPATPPDYPIPVYSTDTRIPRPSQLIGELSVGDTPFTIFGGSLQGEMDTIMDTAHAKGADVVQIVHIKKPDFESAHYRIEANLLRYTDKWETVHLSEHAFLEYLRQNQAVLDPIEGLWSYGAAEEIGIMKDKAKPGRDFIAFSLNPPAKSWRPGYKRADIAHTDRPDGYSIRYYRSDFNAASTTFLLRQGRTFSFIINAYGDATEVTMFKLATPPPTN